MKQYIELLKQALGGDPKLPARAGMPGTTEVFGAMLKMPDVVDHFPLLTTKKVNFHNIVTELLWFLRGETNIYDLLVNGCNIWNDDAYKFYLSQPRDTDLPKLTKEDFIQRVKDLDLVDYHSKNTQGDYRLGDLGPVYGAQWRNFAGNYSHYGFDQISALVSGILAKPDSRYHIVTAWSPVEFKKLANFVALPACHVYFQCNVRNRKYLDMVIMQRSCDLFLGVPYNLASYALLLGILSKMTNLVAGELTWIGGSVHVYDNQVEACKELISREPTELPKLTFAEDFEELLMLFTGHLITIDQFLKELVSTMFIVEGYEPQAFIKAPLSVGV